MSAKPTVNAFVKRATTTPPSSVDDDDDDDDDKTDLRRLPAISRGRRRHCFAMTYGAVTSSPLPPGGDVIGPRLYVTFHPGMFAAAARIYAFLRLIGSTALAADVLPIWTTRAKKSPRSPGSRPHRPSCPVVVMSLWARVSRVWSDTCRHIAACHTDARLHPSTAASKYTPRADQLVLASTTSVKLGSLRRPPS